MNNMKTKILALALVVLLAGCDDFFDINADPNNPTKAELNTILPYIEATLFGAMGFGSAGVTDILAVYVHHTVQRGNHDNYRIQPNEFQNTQPWEQLYTKTLPDINAVIARREEAPIYSGIAKVLKAAMFGYIVDLWGDMPYSEAGDPVNFKFPKYDDDMEIYASLFALIDDGVADINAGGIRPGADDLVYGGDVAKWVKFANSLKLNLYNKSRLTSLYDANAVNALLTANNFISTNAEDFELDYNATITPENRHPGFVREYAQNQPAYYISPYFYLLMKGEQACQNSLMVGIADPRIPYYFYNQLAPGEAAQNPISYRDGDFLSIWFGSYDLDPNEGFDQNISQTLVGLYPVGGAYDDASGVNVSATLGTKGAAPQRLLTAAAIDYVRAELALTMSTSDNARAMFQSAMNKSFAEVNVAAAAVGAPPIGAAAITAYTDQVLALYDAGDNTTKLEVLMTQKWIQEFGNGIETYSDIRRTGFPEVCDPLQDPNEWSTQTNPYPVVLPYNGNDLTNNGSAPGQHDQYSAKVFWDIN